MYIILCFPSSSTYLSTQVYTTHFLTITKLEGKSSSLESMDSYHFLSIFMKTWHFLLIVLEAMMSSAPLEWQWNCRAYPGFVCTMLDLVALFFLELHVAEVKTFLRNIIAAFDSSLHCMQEPVLVWNPLICCERFRSFLRLKLCCLPCGRHFEFGVLFIPKLQQSVTSAFRTTWTRAQWGVRIPGEWGWAWRCTRLSSCGAYKWDPPALMPGVPLTSVVRYFSIS